MTRIFSTLAILAVTLLAVNIFLGLRIGDLNGSYQQIRAAQQQVLQQRSAALGAANATDKLDAELSQRYEQLEPLQRRATLHRMCGMLAALIALLVNSIAVTYFIGTNRWCKEVVQAYQLDEQFEVESDLLKRRTFPWSLAGIVAVLAIVACGAAADPGTLRQGTQAWVTVHYATALGGMSLIVISFLVQASRMVDNAHAIDQVLSEVRRIRTERGLEIDD